MNANNRKCTLCDNKGFIYVEREIVIGSRHYGTIPEMKDCPRCVRAEHCATCGDFGMIRFNVPYDDPRFGQVVPCDDCEKGRAMSAAALENALRNAELPDRYKKLSFRTWQHIPFRVRMGKELAYHAALLFAQAHGQNFEIMLSDIYAAAGIDFDGEDRPANALVLQGEPGVGKTGLVAAICNFLTASSTVLPLYSRCRDLISTVQGEYGQTERPSTPALERYKKCALLIVDEMNLGNIKADRQDILEEIMRYRHGNALPTLLTMNINRETFATEWGTRTAKAVYEMSHWITLTGVPIRNEGAVVREAVLS